MIRRYKHKDYATLIRWYRERGVIAPSYQNLSDMGFIVDERVAGFLYLTTGNLAVIDCVISDKRALPSSRSQSLQVLASLLVDTALMMGYTNILALTNNKTVKALAKKNGFKKIEYEAYLLEEKSTDEEAETLGVDG